MLTINDLVEAAYQNKKSAIERCLLSNININSKADYPTEGLKDLFDTFFEWHYMHPLSKRLAELHPGEWKCSAWRIEMLNTFTPLAAAIFGGHNDLVSWLLDECKADINTTITMHSYSARPRLWPDSFVNVNMLGLALMVGNHKIIDNICKRLQQNNLLNTALRANITMKQIRDSSIIEAYEIPLKLNDIQSLNILFGYYKDSELNLDIFYTWIQNAYIAGKCKIVKQFIATIMQTTSQQEVADKIITLDLICLAAKNQDNSTCAYLIKLLTPEQFNNYLSAGRSEDQAKGNTPLHVAAELQSLFLLKFLFKNEYDVNVQNFEGNTALHLALLQTTCNPEIIQYLIDHGAVTDIKNNEGKTAIDLCRQPYISKNILTQRSQVKNKALQSGSATQPEVTHPTINYAAYDCLWLSGFRDKRANESDPLVPIAPTVQAETMTEDKVVPIGIKVEQKLALG